MKNSETRSVIRLLVDYLKEISKSDDITITSISDNEDLINVDCKIVYLLTTINHSYHQSLSLEELSPNNFFKFNRSEFQRRLDSNFRGSIEYLYGYVKYHTFSIDKAIELNSNTYVQNFYQLVGFDPYSYDNTIDVYIIIFEYKNDEKYIVCGTHAVSLESAHKKISFLKSIDLVEINNFIFLNIDDCEDMKMAVITGKYDNIKYFIKTIKIKPNRNPHGYTFTAILDTKNGLNERESKIPLTIFKSPWRSEATMVEILKELYPQKTIFTQYTPFFINEKDPIRFRYDAYIYEDKIAVEYQGIQHFCPVDYFGGEEGFKKDIERDKYKEKKSIQHGISIAYINYYESLTPELVKSRVTEAKKNRRKKANA